MPSTGKPGQGIVTLDRFNELPLAGLEAGLDRLGDTTRAHDLEVASEQVSQLRATLVCNQRVPVWHVEGQAWSTRPSRLRVMEIQRPIGREASSTGCRQRTAVAGVA